MNDNNFNNYQPPQQQFPNPPGSTPGKTMAIIALVAGILAWTCCIPFLDVVFGVAGIVLAVMAKNKGYGEGLQLAALLVSIIGTVAAVGYTIYWMVVGTALFAMPWTYM